MGAKLDKGQQDKNLWHTVWLGQWEDPVGVIDDTGVMVLGPGVYSCHQFSAVKQQQMACLEGQTGCQAFAQPQTKPFSDPVGRLDHISKVRTLYSPI